MKKEKRVWDLFPRLSTAVWQTHEEYMTRLNCRSFHCHDFDHALRVGQRALEIADDPRIGQLASIAGLCHNADRLLQKEDGCGPTGIIDDVRVIALTTGWIRKAGTEIITTQSEEDQIIDAVLRHGQPNGPNDGPVLINLMDADRTVNIELDVIARNAQYAGDSLPIIDPYNFIYAPDATFRSPGCTLRGDYEKFDWRVEGGFVGIRLAKARKLAEPRFELLQKYFDDVIMQRMHSGLFPYPKFC